MAQFLIVVGIIGFAACALVPDRMDRVCVRVRAQIKLWLNPPVFLEPDLFICSRLIASLRAGISLDAAIQQLSKEAKDATRERLIRITDGNPPADFLSRYLSAAIRNGMPTISTLHIFQTILQSKRRLQLRSTALTSQSRAQAEVLSWLPWSLAIMLFVVDGEWVRTAAASSFSWFLWAVALGLTGVGRAWMKFLLRRALEPNSLGEAMEERELPELTLRMIAEISMGTDADTALERSLHDLRSTILNQAWLGNGEAPEKLLQLKGVLDHASQTGAPLREDLQNFLQSLYAELESRWETRVQRLPVVLMLPLFVCFFPGTLIVLASLLAPMLWMLG